MKNSILFHKYSVLGLFVIALLFSVFVFAGDMYKDGRENNINRESKFTLGGNVYVLGEYLDTDKDVVGDFFSVSRSLVVNKNVQDDLNTVATHVVVDGDIKDDVRLVAKKAIINGEVGGSLIFFGGNLVISPTAVVGGDMFVIGEVLRVDGRVLGNIFVNGELVQLGDSARVSGDLNVSVYSKEDVIISEKASISGDVVFSQLGYEDDKTAETDYWEYFWFILGFAMFGLLLALILREKVTFFKKDFYEQLKAFSIGVLTLLLLIPFIILCHYVFGFTIGTFVMLTYLGLVSLGAILIPVYFGELIRDLTKTNWDYRVYPLVAGAILALLFLLKYTILLVFILHIIVVGLIVMKLFKRIC